MRGDSSKPSSRRRQNRDGTRPAAPAQGDVADVEHVENGMQTDFAVGLPKEQRVEELGHGIRRSERLGVGGEAEQFDESRRIDGVVAADVPQALRLRKVGRQPTDRHDPARRLRLGHLPQDGVLWIVQRPVALGVRPYAKQSKSAVSRNPNSGTNHRRNLTRRSKAIQPPAASPASRVQWAK